ncbi:3-hydroxyacyl-CoA dehydrogenase family protein [Xanthobacter oligotrophicus]|uniref:3-hydroxyacyl-CoA dehydrogenase family protein n=1 Tax=Xanthobacter oligotrophicus TaxID=2607286 RepID=UPI0011F1498E|nr:3-hydroxyacyl-CoA dehydrogenase NAD-binding domain-containing protein [Xanthobacter oligotrophicus]MCG5237969.1 3-hydroxyacyl-CoA dehydrogenase NAD-binding domain-containing protein [Xanthobacter oligotrophicus]
MTAHPITAVVGAGLMGHGIAQVFATRGHQVRVFDPMPEALASLRSRIDANLSALGQDPGAARRVLPCQKLADAVAGVGLVIEAATENLNAKRALFAKIEASAPADAILATNTSVIPIGSIMAGLARPERALGTHWWNPPYLVPLVEVIGTDRTAPDVVSRTMDILAAAGKTPVHVRRDVAGFIGNRLQHALWREAISLVEEGVCDAETVDTVVKASFGLRLAVLGPLENADLVGTDLTLAIHETIIPALNCEAGPSAYLRDLVAQGRLGMRSGEGFRHWPPQAADQVRAALVRHLKDAVRKSGQGEDA